MWFSSHFLKLSLCLFIDIAFIKFTSDFPILTYFTYLCPSSSLTFQWPLKQKITLFETLFSPLRHQSLLIFLLCYRLFLLNILCWFFFIFQIPKHWWGQGLTSSQSTLTLCLFHPMPWLSIASIYWKPVIYFTAWSSPLISRLYTQLKFFCLEHGDHAT